MVKPPHRPPPQKRKSDLPARDVVASRAVVPKKRDPRQAGIFDAPLPAFIRPQLAKLVTEAPEGTGSKPEKERRRRCQGSFP
jgi:hypothetical protein